jgi:glycerophosphoryl diester phosphodiesterase
LKYAILTIIIMTANLVFAFQLVGHRGAPAYAPENTLESIMMAYEQGALAAECDLQITKDGKLVLMHDDSLLRTGRVDRRVDELNVADLMLLDVGSWKGQPGVKVPLLTDVVQQIPDNRLLFVEIKGGDRNEGVSDAMFVALLDFIEKTPPNIIEKLVFISFNHEVLFRLKYFLNHIAIMPLMTHKQAFGSWPQIHNLTDLHQYIDMAKQQGCLGLSLEYGNYLSRLFIDYIKAQGLMVAVWNYQEDDTVEVARTMREWGVDFYNTDDVRQVRAALGL